MRTIIRSSTNGHYHNVILLPTLSFFFCLFLITSSNTCYAQEQQQQQQQQQDLISSEDVVCQSDGGSIGVCSNNNNTNNKSDSIVDCKDQDTCDNDEEEEEEEDPLLVPMHPNFKAYMRADISSFYQEAPGSRIEQKPKFRGQAGKFINMSPLNVNVYWDDGRGGRYTGNVQPWRAGGTASFPTHKFFFALSQNPEEIVCRFVIKEGVVVYYFDPFTTKENDEFVQIQPGSRGTIENVDKYSMSLEDLSIQQKEMYDAHRYNLNFGVQYKQFTGGNDWLSMYPRSPPKHKLWRADYFGQEHVVQTKETQFVEIPPPEEIESWNMMTFAKSRKNTTDVPFQPYRSHPTNPDGTTTNITIRAISCAPRAFEIQNFLSHSEVDHLLHLVQTKKQLYDSTVGGGAGSSTQAKQSSVRTSRNTWIERSLSPVLDAIHRRVADVLRFDEALLRQRLPGEVIKGYENTRGQINEHIQIVHYDPGQEYTPHHDFGYHDGKPNHQKISRSINVALYLNEGMQGGETAFPRWRNGETTEGLKITPQKGKAVIFYMYHPDGNLDDLTQHAGLPVISGEKWFANLWVWDPYRP